MRNRWTAGRMIARVFGLGDDVTLFLVILMFVAVIAGAPALAVFAMRWARPPYRQATAQSAAGLEGSPSVPTERGTIPAALSIQVATTAASAAAIVAWMTEAQGRVSDATGTIGLFICLALPGLGIGLSGGRLLSAIIAGIAAGSAAGIVESILNVMQLCPDAPKLPFKIFSGIGSCAQAHDWAVYGALFYGVFAIISAPQGWAIAWLVRGSRRSRVPSGLSGRAVMLIVLLNAMVPWLAGNSVTALLIAGVFAVAAVWGGVKVWRGRAARKDEEHFVGNYRI